MVVFVITIKHFSLHMTITCRFVYSTLESHDSSMFIIWYLMWLFRSLLAHLNYFHNVVIRLNLQRGTFCIIRLCHFLARCWIAHYVQGVFRLFARGGVKDFFEVRRRKFSQFQLWNLELVFLCKHHGGLEPFLLGLGWTLIIFILIAL